MITYLGIFLFLALLAMLDIERYEALNIKVFAVLTFLLLLVGTRDNVGCDYVVYAYKYMISGQLLEASTGLFDGNSNEIGFLYLNNFFASHGWDLVWFNLFVTLMFVIGFFLYVRRHPDPLFLIAVLFPFLFLGLAMSGVRQTMAFAFFLAGVSYLLKNRPFSYAACILVGALFHTSVVFFLPLAIIPWVERQRVGAAIAFMILVPIGFALAQSRVGVYSERYIEGDTEAAGAIIRAAVISIPGFAYFAWPKKFVLQPPVRDHFVRYGSILAVSILPITLYSSVAGERLGLYIAPFSASIAMHLIMTLEGNRRTQARLIALGLVGGYLFAWLLLSDKADQCYIPYDSTLFSIF